MSKKDLPKNVKINNRMLQIYSYSYKSPTQQQRSSNYTQMSQTEEWKLKKKKAPKCWQ